MGTRCREGERRGGEGRGGTGERGAGKGEGSGGRRGGRGGEISEPLFLYRIYTKLLVMFTRLIAMNVSNLVITFLESNKQNYFHMHAHNVMATVWYLQGNVSVHVNPKQLLLVDILVVLVSSLS